MPAPRKYPQELRDRAARLVAEAMAKDPGLSLNAATKRIGPKVGVLPDRKMSSSVRQAVVNPS